MNYDALRTNLEYNLGTVLSFRAVDTVNSANPFIMLGFSGAEQNFTWTDGRESQMLFKLLPAKANRDLLCKMEYGVYAGPQRVIVNANGKKILEYTAKNHEKKVFFIPKEIIQNDELLLSFSFPDAVSPKKRGESNDARELALSMRSLSISEYYPTECELGKTLFFRTGENSAKPFICSGFSGAEKNFTWTDGHEAQMFFKLPHSSRGKNLICKIEHGTYASKQRVIVKANERIVLEYSTTGHQKKEFVIPAYVVSNDELLLTFILPDAVSPKERGESSDERVLALAMQSLCIDEGHPSGNRMAGGPYEYVMGKLLSFKADVNSAEPFILNGFSRAEKNYTWTNGYEAQMAFKLPRSGNGRKLLCKMKHGTYAVPQRVIVKANGKVVLAYTSTGQQEKEFVIPADAIINDELHLTFVLPDADSPKARGESEDSSEYFTPRKPVVHVKGTTGSRQ